MRRTHAPSKGGFRPACSAAKKDTKPFPEAARSTVEVLGLLADSTTAINVDSELQTSAKFQHIPESIVSDDHVKRLSESILADKRIYNVVWGKQTKRKHKTWEGDGTVEVSKEIAILKDTNGAVLGRSSKFNTVLEEGSRAFIGSKEIEVIDIVNKEEATTETPESRKESNELQFIDSTCRRPFKRSKLDSEFRTPLAGDNDNLLVMPLPDYAHQWKYNSKKLPIHEVKLDMFLSRILRDHQQEGVLFLYSCISGISNVDYNGAILADEMGLGKTLQCISLIWMLLKHGPYGGFPFVQRILIVTPSSLVTNWLKEFKKWVGFERLHPYIINKKQKVADFVKFVPSQKPILIISYEMLVRQYEDLKKCKFQLLICDEGHRLKNNQIQVAQFLSQLDIKRKIILTGTPVQNNLQEFFCLIDFVNPGILGSYQEFKKYFESPIVQSNQPECCEEMKELGVQRASELSHRTSAFILRRTQNVIDHYLPSKQECVVICSPSQLQIKLYEAVISYWEDSIIEGSAKVPHLSVITILKKICNDPRLIRSMDSVSIDDDGGKIHASFGQGLLNQLQPFFNEYENELNLSLYSSKLFVLEQFLEALHQTAEKVVLISYFTQTLDLLRDLCERRNYKFLRLDGNTSAVSRSEAVDRFNARDSKFFVFLLSAKAGGVGLNLVGASRLVLFDLDWNPASDLQAMSRIWRDGQKRNVYIYRFLTAGTIEEKIYQRQISKTFLSNAVITMQKDSDFQLSVDELKDLFTFVPDSHSLTHESLMCECEGCGLPESAVDENVEAEEERTGQLGLTISHTAKNEILKISELTKWEHYISPIDENVLEELCLKSASPVISFVFRNTSMGISNLPS